MKYRIVKYRLFNHHLLKPGSKVLSIDMQHNNIILWTLEPDEDVQVISPGWVKIFNTDDIVQAAEAAVLADHYHRTFHVFGAYEIHVFIMPEVPVHRDPEPDDLIAYGTDWDTRST